MLDDLVGEVARELGAGAAGLPSQHKRVAPVPLTAETCLRTRSYRHGLCAARAVLFARERVVPLSVSLARARGGSRGVGARIPRDRGTGD